MSDRVSSLSGEGLIQKFLTINEQGLPFFDPDGPAIQDRVIIEEIFNNLKLTEKFGLVTEVRDEAYLVESFDHPIVIQNIEVRDKKLLLVTNHQMVFQAQSNKWSVDEWDRFNGLTTSNAPFVLTKQAQAQLFDLVDSFDDESFVVNGEYIATPPYYIDTPEIEKSHYWADVYKTEGNPGWNLNQPANALIDMLPRLKLPRSRILVLGAGEGHDAALFAQAGHVVTAVDFSKEGLERGRQKYAGLAGLHFEHLNIFDIPTEWNHSFDVVVEHTCYCAIPPDQRNELVRLWRRMLHEEGQLMGVFFAMEKRSGPPYGGTEWELRKRLQDYFQFLFWGRWRKSIPQRQGRELFVLARKT